MAAPIGRRVLGTYSICRRCFSCSTVNLKGVVLGVYEPAQKDDVPELTPAAKHYDQTSDGQLTSVLNTVCRGLKGGKSRVLYPRAGAYDRVSVVCLGKRGAGYSTLEEIQEGRENVRKAVAAGVRHLRDVGETEVCVDPCGDPEAAAEGTTLSLFSYDELKNPESRKPLVKASCYTDHSPADSSQIRERWSHGSVLGESQNWSRQLMEMPGNKLTPLIFSQIVTERLYAQGVTVKVRDEEWMESEKMGAFLSVTRGSEEPAVFVELDYSGADSSVQPFALVGKGVTFDSGGISLKPGASMDLMRGDMGGAACVVGAMSALARLKAPLNVRGFIPLCENMPSGKATKPGDVVTARNGKTIQVDNTDAEGRLILADALCYAETFNPYLILDVATLTGAIDVALGSAVTGVYTNSPLLWPYLHQAGQQTGDRVWRMPLLDHYSRQVKDSQLADLNNIGKAGPSGSSCTAAAFLKEFVTNENWFHLDIAGVMTNKDEISYLGKGMSGRPVRTVAEFLQRVGNSLNK